MTTDPNIPLPPPPRPPTQKSTPFTIVLSVCLALFLADAIASLVDDSLILFFGLHVFSAIRGLVAFFALLMAVAIYITMAFAPTIPKRLFVPVALFNPFVALVAIPFSIFYFGYIPWFSWTLSLCQVIFALGMVCWLQGGLKLRWPLMPENRLEVHPFTWRNLSLFILANVFVLAPAVIIYLACCAALAVDHFSEGFVKLRPAGFTMQVRKYARNDGKTIELFPMSHIAGSDFYQKVSQSFPSNSIILMEGVSDEKHLLTNQISYKRMAAALGLAEQHAEFKPSHGEVVRADVDVDQFTTNTIDLLNLVMLIHAKGLTPETLMLLTQNPEPPHFEDQLFDDLLNKRNRHLLEEIHNWLPRTDHIVVPWGAAHMPGLGREIQKSGFHLEETRDILAIRFHGRL